MPLYVVRRPLLAASLVHAEDEYALLDFIAQADDPTLCRWEVYRGPLAFDLTLPVDHAAPVVDEGYGEVRPQEVHVGPVGPLIEEGFVAWPADHPLGVAMVHALYRAVWPRLAKALGGRRVRESTVARAVRAEIVAGADPAAGSARWTTGPRARPPAAPTATRSSNDAPPPDGERAPEAQPGRTPQPAAPTAAGPAADLAGLLGVPLGVAHRYLAAAAAPLGLEDEAPAAYAEVPGPHPEAAPAGYPDARPPAPSDRSPASPAESARVALLVERWLEETGLVDRPRIGGAELRGLALAAYRAGRRDRVALGVAEGAAP